MKRIAVIGNGGGGKTTLSHSLAARYGIPLTHVDSIQYLAGMQVRPIEETRAELERIASQTHWLIDGFGPMDVMQRRFLAADKVLFVDFPLWRHYWWCTKRQIRSLRASREELPDGCNEATIAYTFKLFRILWRVHTQIKPQLEKFFAHPEMKSKVIRVATLAEWQRVHRDGLFSLRASESSSEVGEASRYVPHKTMRPLLTTPTLELVFTRSPNQVSSAQRFLVSTS